MYKRDHKVILFDTTFLFDQYSNRGIGRYGKEVLRRLFKMILDEGGWEIHLIGFLDLHQNLIEFGFNQYSIEEIKDSLQFHSIGEPKPSTIGNIRTWGIKYKPIIEKLDPDIYFGVHFERGLPSDKLLNLNINKNIKTVVVVHDVIPMINNSFSKKSFFHNLIRKNLYRFMWNGVKNADLIFTPSDFSKKDLIKYGEVAEAKIRRIYLGINDFFFRDGADLPSPEVEAEILNTYKLKDESGLKRYFFYDSGLEANKGIDNLISIFKNFKDSTNASLPNYLVLVGGDLSKGIGEEIKARTNNGKWLINFAKSLGVLNNIIATDRIPDLDLQVMLFNAKAYIYLSNYEGFGFGPLQAMAAHIPAIAANRSCIPEITKGGALLIDPVEHEKSAKEIEEFLTNEAKLNDHIKMALEIAKQYNWDKTVAETWEEVKRISN